MRSMRSGVSGAPLWTAMGVVAMGVAGRACGSIVWNGPLTTFTKSDGADPSLAANQDRITSNVWITRGGSRGLFNAKTESSFTHFLSPAGTAWASGSLANYASLTYSDWNTWANGVNLGPPTTVGVDAVVHLLTDDVYLSVKFTSWSQSATGGGFSYQRSTVPAPASLGILGLGGLILARHRRI